MFGISREVGGIRVVHPSSAPAAPGNVVVVKWRKGLWDAAGVQSLDRWTGQWSLAAVESQLESQSHTLEPGLAWPLDHGARFPRA